MQAVSRVRSVTNPMTDWQRSIDELYMATAYRFAARGLYTVVRNNPRVGCVIVKEGRVVGRGWHAEDGDAHAEIHALDQADRHAKSATAYVTLEPCNWVGRTGACTTALIEAGISRVVIGERDHHPRVDGAGLSALESAGISTTQVWVPQFEDLNPGCRMRHAHNRPFVRIKLAVSVDGRTAMADGSSQWITGEAARSDVQHWRARSGAVLTGRGTVEHDDPRLTVRDPRFGSACPWRVVLDSSGSISPDARLFREAGRTILVCGRDARPNAPLSDEDLWRVPGAKIEIEDVLHRLGDEGVNELLVEAGPTLVGAFLKARLWDELLVYVAPKVMGATARPLASVEFESLADAHDATIKSVTSLGSDVRITLTAKHGHSSSRR